MRRVEVELAIKKLNRAYERLAEAVEVAVDDLDRDGVIQRFEFTVELLWKTLKVLLAYNKVECTSPRDCVKKAFRHSLIEDDDIVLDMLDDRNRSSHIYDEKTSREIFERIRDVYVDAVGEILRRISEVT